MNKSLLTSVKTHFKCRTGLYPGSNVARALVPDDKVPWSVRFADYKPLEYNSDTLEGKIWADPVIESPSFHPVWNKLDNKVNRQSYSGTYNVVNKYPQNPFGRTGINGRGRLGRWGPNHAADPIVTKWKRDNGGIIVKDINSLKPILQFVAIKRHDNGQWALPGGMVDPGEKVSATAVREFMEEATNSLEMSEESKHQLNSKLSKFFSEGQEVFSGYVDDPRNTDNAWMETVAFNFHDEQGNIVGDIPFQAGDDAAGVQWIDFNNNLDLYASHKDLLEAVVNLKNCHW